LHHIECVVGFAHQGLHVAFLAGGSEKALPVGQPQAVARASHRQDLTLMGPAQAESCQCIILTPTELTSNRLKACCVPAQQSLGIASIGQHQGGRAAEHATLGIHCRP
jgi:hypothetical protein